jgi:hypothetical protein
MDAKRVCKTAILRRQVGSTETSDKRSSGADSERIDEFFRYGMWLNVAAAMGVEDLSAGCDWMLAEALDPPADGR